jgi:Transcriptional regulatory protein, C terminal/FHA domain
VVYTIGGCTLDTDARQLYRDGEPVHLSPKAFALIEYLAAHAPRAIAKQELFDRLWPDTFVVEANLAVLIREVRAAIADQAKTIIRTVHGHGYACAAHPAPAPSRAPGSHLLIREGREYLLQAGENVIGRDPSATVLVASQSVSRRHAVIVVDDRGATIADLQSKNGTCVNGLRVDRPRALEDGSVVVFGKVEMIYRRAPELIETETTV